MTSFSDKAAAKSSSLGWVQLKERKQANTRARGGGRGEQRLGSMGPAELPRPTPLASGPIAAHGRCDRALLLVNDAVHVEIEVVELGHEHQVTDNLVDLGVALRELAGKPEKLCQSPRRWGGLLALRRSVAEHLPIDRTWERP